MYLKDFTLVVFPQIISKDVGVHQSPPTLAQNVHGLLQKLYFDPRHVVLLHLIHLLLHHGVQLVLELQWLQVIHVPIAIKKVTRQGCSGLLLAFAGIFGFIFVISRIKKKNIKMPKNATLQLQYLLQLYHELPWGSQGPRQTQQKSALQAWFLQIMWLQPPSFSMIAPHFGHSLVLAEIQLDVSESSSHFLIHFLIRWQRTGSCQFSEHAKQNEWPHRHLTGLASTVDTLIALEQLGAGHHRNKRLHCKNNWFINESERQKMALKTYLNKTIGDEMLIL